MNKKIYGFALSALALGMLASCSNDVKEPADKGQESNETLTMVIAQDPKIDIWSGETALVGEKTRSDENGTTKYDQKEVEINLAVNDLHEKYDIEDLVSHLSIHVRTATNVTVTLPVEEKFYCDQDDIYIYGERLKEGTLNKDVYFKGSTSTTSYKFTEPTTEEEGEPTLIGEVTVEVIFVQADRDENGNISEAEDANKGYIQVNITGVNDKVLAYCNEKYADGVNFDIYNYYLRGNQYTTGSYASYTLPDLLGALNESEVKFTGVTNVEYYINAFTHDIVKYNNTEYYRDCWVAPVEGEGHEDDFWGPAYIGTETEKNHWNHVYLNKAKFPAAQDGGIQKPADSGEVNPANSSPE